MSTVTNLNKFRKQKARQDKRAQAAENTVKFGRSRAEKDAEKARADTASRDLDGHKREP